MIWWVLGASALVAAAFLLVMVLVAALWVWIFDR